ncbi:hypothetical protein K431DRAFT_309950 [Polychaeton citri CBS 116435]|uniref:DUF1989 domain-containing protein n=1 Tax=Polychaeton citri CBS 116435 TaxID=1314669 RepID=A0A9P4QH84_9PEZI|nr:hypothetical protein K431DRAFT_309950 [Polychaeton citri CBS 116435]
MPAETTTAGEKKGAQKSEEQELQTIPARHGVATFVPAGQTIKIVNTSGSQVVDTWAFALPKPDPKKDGNADSEAAKDEKPKNGVDDAKAGAEKVNGEVKQKGDEAKGVAGGKATPAKKTAKKGNADFPSQEEAEKAVQEGYTKGQDATKDATAIANKTAQQQKSTWSSYVPSIGWSSSNKQPEQQLTQKEKDERSKNSKTWASYFPSGKGFSSYVPKGASDTVSSFAATHKRDTNKSYLQQLQDFSKTPVGAAGLSALTGSGYSSSIYAGYSAWTAANVPAGAPMQYMSMPHTRASTLHIRPQVDDVLVSNLREPMLILVEDSSPGVHDTLIAACDPQRYQGLGVESWEEHGSCAENLVLALKELNERAGLKGSKAVGADVTINSVPAPLNLFMNIPWNAEGVDGQLSFDAPATKAGDYVRLRAVRDVVVVMSACPQDVLKINNQNPTDAHFVVEEEPKESQKAKKPVPQKRQSSRPQVPRKASSQQGTPGKKPVPVRRKMSTQTQQTESVVNGETGKPASKPQVQKNTPASKQAGVPKANPPRAASAKDTPAPSTNGQTTTPVEKKKPRKLRPKANPEDSAAA